MWNASLCHFCSTLLKRHTVLCMWLAVVHLSTHWHHELYMCFLNKMRRFHQLMAKEHFLGDVYCIWCHWWMCHILYDDVIPAGPALGDEGSKTLEESLLVLDTCSESFFFVLPSDGLGWDFLFLMRIFPASSWGLGRGTPDSSYNTSCYETLRRRRWEYENDKLTRYFSRGSVRRASPKIDLQYSAILACCLGLWRTTQDRWDKQQQLNYLPINTMNQGRLVFKGYVFCLCLIFNRFISNRKKKLRIYYAFSSLNTTLYWHFCRVLWHPCTCFPGILLWCYSNEIGWRHASCHLWFQA